MAWNHHPTLDDLRYEHGFAEWTDDMVAEHNRSLCGPDGMPDWLAIRDGLRIAITAYLAALGGEIDPRIPRDPDPTRRP